MPYCKISQDLKLTAIRLYEQNLLPLEDILDCIGFSEHTFECIRSLWNWLLSSLVLKVVLAFFTWMILTTFFVLFTSSLTGFLMSSCTYSRPTTSSVSTMSPSIAHLFELELHKRNSRKLLWSTMKLVRIHLSSTWHNTIQMS
jgi:hypothetical protein